MKKGKNWQERMNERTLRVDGQLTFCGVLVEDMEECARNWHASSTRKQYMRDYLDRIFPALEGCEERPIASYTLEDYEQALEKIRSWGQRPGEEFVPYAESTMDHFAHLIGVVVKVGAAHGYCEQVLWGTRFLVPEELSETELIRELVKLQKSLSPDEEKLLYAQLCVNVEQDGEKMGLMLMFTLGLRNNEAAGLDYGDLRALTEHPNCYAAWIYKSTVQRGNSRKASGKTQNADRVVPIMAKVMAFLKKRRRWVEAKLPGVDVDQLPVACVGRQFEVGCSADHLTQAGRELFRSLGMSGERLAYLDAAVHRKEVSVALRIKDPTSYLLRRNFGTMMALLCLLEAEIQYVLGHDVEDPFETRNEFINEEKLYRLWLKMNRRPLFWDDGETAPGEIQLQNGEARRLEAGDSKLLFRLDKPGTLYLRVHTDEPQDTLQVTLEQDGGQPMELESHIYQTESEVVSRTIDVMQAMTRAYQMNEGAN